MANLTTGDWQRIGYYNIRTTSTISTYISLNAKIDSINYSARTAVVATLLNLDNVSYAYTTDGISAGMTGCTNMSWGRTTFGTGTNTTLLQGGFTVSYDDNGNASCNIQCWVNQTWGGNLSMQTVGCSLQNIGAKETHTASQPSINTWPNNSPNITAGQTCYIHCNQGSDTAIRHDVYYTIGSKTEYIKYDFQTNCQWTPSTSLCSLFPNANSMSGTVYLKSFVNGTLIGTKSCPFVLSVPSYSLSVSIASIEETNSNVKNIVSNETVQGLSSKKVTVNAGTSYSASISGVWCNGVQLSASNGQYVGTLSNMQTGTYSVSVKDSRGKTASTAASQNYNYYSKPSITGSASRTSQTGKNGSLTVTGTYSQIKSNTATVTITRVSPSATETQTYTGSNSFSKTISYSDLVYTTEFTWNVSVKDRFNQTATNTIKLGMGQYALWLGKTNCTLGKGSKILDNSNTIKTLVDMFYPVGSYYETSNTSFNPNTTWGGTWVEDSKDRVLIGGGSSFGYGSTGGAIFHSHSTNGHALTISEMPAHNHGFAQNVITNGGQTDAGSGNAWWRPTGLINSTNMTGGSGYHSHGDTNITYTLPPYVAIKRWHRTA